MNEYEPVYDADWYHSLRDVVDELMDTAAKLPSERDIDVWTRDEVLQAMTQCHHVLSRVLRSVIEIYESGNPPRALQTDADAALAMCIQVHLHIDSVYSDLLPLTRVAFPRSWDEL